MTALATSPVFWIGLMASLAALYVLPTMVAVIRHVEEIALMVFLNCIPVAWPAALVVACMMPRKEVAGTKRYRARRVQSRMICVRGARTAQRGKRAR